MMVRTGSGISGWKPAAGAPLVAKPPEAKFFGRFERLGDVFGGCLEAHSNQLHVTKQFTREGKSKTANERAKMLG